MVAFMLGSVTSLYIKRTEYIWSRIFPWLNIERTHSTAPVFVTLPGDVLLSIPAAYLVYPEQRMSGFNKGIVLEANFPGMTPWFTIVQSDVSNKSNTNMKSAQVDPVKLTIRLRSSYGGAYFGVLRHWQELPKIAPVERVENGFRRIEGSKVTSLKYGPYDYFLIPEQQHSAPIWFGCTRQGICRGKSGLGHRISYTFTLPIHLLDRWQLVDSEVRTLVMSFYVVPS